MCLLVPKQLLRVIFVSFFFLYSHASLSLDLIEICLLAETQDAATTTEKNDAKLFHLHFGDPAVEVLNALKSSDILRIKLLSKCIKREELFLFEESK